MPGRRPWGARSSVANWLPAGSSWTIVELALVPTQKLPVAGSTARPPAWMSKLRSIVETVAPLVGSISTIRFGSLLNRYSRLLVGL